MVQHIGEGDNKRSRWTNIGVAFENPRRQLEPLRFDYPAPSNMADTTIQMRAFHDPRSEEQPSGLT